MADNGVFVISEMKRFGAEQFKKVVLDVTANLIEDTPVDTGHARANWVPRVKAPFDDEVSDQSAQQTGIAEVATATEIKDPVYVSNNVPYIQRLNEGHSQQAPAKFVERAIQRAVDGD